MGKSARFARRENLGGPSGRIRIDFRATGCKFALTEEALLMNRFVFITIALFVSASGAFAQVPKHIALTPKSTVPIAVLADGMDKTCVGVVLTLDQSKADYLLEATTTEKFNDGNSIIRAQFTLFATNGDVLFHTTTRKYKNAMKDVCNAIGSGKKK
jgi:hypothetical protein